MYYYRNWLTKCIISTRSHKFEEYYCDIVGFKNNYEKICVYIKVIYSNCDDNHLASSPQSLSKYKTDVITHIK